MLLWRSPAGTDSCVGSCFFYARLCGRECSRIAAVAATRGQDWMPSAGSGRDGSMASIYRRGGEWRGCARHPAAGGDPLGNGAGRVLGKWQGGKCVFCSLQDLGRIGIKDDNETESSKIQCASRAVFVKYCGIRFRFRQRMAARPLSVITPCWEGICVSSPMEVV